jgi:hypothetical protein
MGHFQRAIGILLSQTRQVVLNFREFPVSLTQASGTGVKARDDVQMRRVHNKTIAQTTTDTIFSKKVRRETFSFLVLAGVAIVAVVIEFSSSCCMWLNGHCRC